MKALLRGAFEGARHPSPWDNQEPIREELFSIERLEDHARSLAVAQIVSVRPTKGRPLARRLAANRAVLLDAYRSAVKAINDGRAITPASEWLVDNYHLVEKQIHEIHSDLPPGYYRQLPKLAAGPFAGYPRVFGMAWAFVAHTDSRFDPEMLVRFVRAYQDVQPLTIGELWAVSITLRIVLVENLGRLARQITKAAQNGKLPMVSRIVCSAQAGDCPSRSLSFSSRPSADRCRKPSRSSLCIGCAIRIRTSRPR